VLGLALVAGSTLATACGDEVDGDRAPPAPLGTPCPDRAGMVVIPPVRDEPPFCIDQYEARVQVGELGDPVQPVDGNGTTSAVAVSERFALPTGGVTWHQARSICRNSGKRLCTAGEWRRACGGERDLTYPYGDAFAPGRCNGFSAGRAGIVETGAMIEAVVDDDGTLVAQGCVSPFGVYDVSGNVWEWNATPFLGGAERGLAGGSHRANADGLSCINDDARADPARADPTYGFRCCTPLP